MIVNSIIKTWSRFGMLNNLNGAKKKLIMLSAAIALSGGMLAIHLAVPDTKAMGSENSTSDSHRPAATNESNINSLFASDSNFSGKSGYEAASRELYFKTIIAVLFVLVLGIAAVYVSKKILPKITNMPGKEIHLIETTHLGPRKSVHLLEIGSRRFLIGSTNERINILADLNPMFMSPSNQEIDDTFEKINDSQSL
jgi:flagellar biosynthetic protein FliO